MRGCGVESRKPVQSWRAACTCMDRRVEERMVTHRTG